MDGNYKRDSDVYNSKAPSRPPPVPPYADDAGRIRGDDHGYSDDDYDDYDDDEEESGRDENCGLRCPFCFEDFDVLGLCCHVDVAHHKEVKAAICPLCALKVDNSMAVHLLTQHEMILKTLSKLKFRGSASGSALSRLKKELHDDYMRVRSKGSSASSSSAAVENDSLFLPFFYNPQLPVKCDTAEKPNDSSLNGNSSQDCDSESRDVKKAALPDENNEKSQRCKFVQELVFSMFLNDDL